MKRNAGAQPFDSTGDRFIPALLLVFAFLTRAAFWNRFGSGDADSMVVAAGMARSLSPGVSFADSLLYGRQISPGMYLLFRAVAPWFAGRPDHVLPVLNAFGLLAGTALAWPLYAFYRRWFAPAVAAGCTVLVLTAPLVWEVGTYFHPVVPAMLLLLLCLMTAERIARTPRGIACGLLTLALGTAALLLRAEVALALPALVFWALRSTRARRNLLLLCGLTAIAGAAFYTIVHALAAGATGRPTTLADYVRDFAQSYFRMRPLRRTLFWSILAIGMGNLLLAALGLARARRREAAPHAPGARATGDAGSGAYSVSGAPTGSGRTPDAPSPSDLGPALLWAFVPVVFWFPNPVFLMRHFLLVVPAVAWIVGETLLAHSRVRWLALWIAVAAVGNVTVPEVVYGVAHRVQAGSARWPHGSFFSHHRAMTRSAARSCQLVAQLERLASGRTAAGDRTAAPLRMLVQASWGAYGYVLYGMATADVPWESCPDGPVDPLLPLQCFRRGNSQLGLLLANEEFDRPLLGAAFERARADHLLLVISEEAAAALGLGPAERAESFIY
jgi:hypothetical protein